MRFRAAGSAALRAGPRRRGLSHQAGRNDESAAKHDRRAVVHVPHGLEFLLAVFQPAFQIVDGALDVVEIQPHVFAGRLIVLELDPAVGPEGDFLGQPFVDGGEGLVDMGDAAVGDFVEVLGNKRGGGQGDGASAPGRRESTGRRARP